MWSPVKGAELYETTAAQIYEVIHCNDTAPVCALSDLSCNTAYSVTVTPCSDFWGCNRTCAPQMHKTGISGADLNDSLYIYSRGKIYSPKSCKKKKSFYNFINTFAFGIFILQLHVLQRS